MAGETCALLLAMPLLTITNGLPSLDHDFSDSAKGARTSSGTHAAVNSGLPEMRRYLVVHADPIWNDIALDHYAILLKAVLFRPTGCGGRQNPRAARKGLKAGRNGGRIRGYAGRHAGVARPGEQRTVPSLTLELGRWREMRHGSSWTTKDRGQRPRKSLREIASKMMSSHSSISCLTGRRWTLFSAPL